MYDKNRFKFVEVLIEKSDYMKEQLVSDLLNWNRHLYLVDDKNYIKYRGLVPVREIKDLELLRAMSPYGTGYKFVVEGEDF